MLPNGNTNYSGEPMVLLDMTEDQPKVMYVDMYFMVLKKLGNPWWMDIEQVTNGRYIIMPLESFYEQFNVQLAPQYLSLMETNA